MAFANVSLARSVRVGGRAPRLVVSAVLVVLSAIACTRTPAPLDLAGRELDVAAPSAAGRFLEARPAFASASPAPLAEIRPASRRDFDPRYERIALRSGDGLVDATLHAGGVRAGTAFGFPCPATAATVRLGVYARAATAGRLRLRIDGREVVLAAPEAERLVFYDAPIDPGRCRTTAEVAVVAAPGDGVLLTEPRMLTAAAAPRPPIILISVDTLRADVWDDVGTATEGMASFRAAAVRYTRAFSSYPSTPMSHSVMLAGMAPTDVSSHPVADALSFVPGLRDAGYATLGFVAGGLVRSEFGFANRAPGFALGFDLYLESYERTRAERDVARSLDAEVLTTYTLAAALDRSLRWFASYPSSPAFHFLHGYDVHEYRTVDRASYERAARAVDSGALQRCVAASGVRFDADEVVHYAFQPRITKRGLDAPLECQRLLFGVFYRARALAAADTLARYFAALRELGVYDRALIVLTSDHGESLRDERGRDGELAWGHNRILANNLRVPLWVKFPESASGAAVDAVAGVIGIRRLVEAVVADPRARPTLDTGRSIPVDSNREGAGIVLPDGTICALNDPALQRPWMAIGSEWSPVDEACTSDAADGARCAAQRACAAGTADLRAADAPHMPSIPPDLEAELRALGYVDP